MLVVAKFGGSSLANAEQFKKVKNIITLNPMRKVVVVSALGKRDSSDSKITDLLFLLHAHLKYSVPYDNIFNMIKDRYIEVAKELNLKIDMDKEFNELKKELNKEISPDFLASRGEFYCAKMMSEYLGYTFVDAKDVILFNYDGSINNDLTKEAIEKAYQEFGTIVIPGFYGSNPSKVIKLLSRGGSDITGSLAARALNVTMYENWTDVSGILMADPRIIKNPKRINQITYSELRELSYMGANVLHEETVIPVQKVNIPINILNTNDPTNPGTVITKNCVDDSQIITGIAGKKHFCSFTIIKKYSSNKSAVLRAALDVFEKYKVNIEHIPTSIDSFSVIVTSEEVQNSLYEIASDIKKISDVFDVKIDEDMALIAVVGRNMVKRAGISGRIFESLGSNNVNIKTIAQGSQELNIILGVSNDNFEKAVKVIYDNLIQ